MIKKLTLGFTTLALAVASAASYSVTFFEPAVINNTTLKPGVYRVQVKEHTAIIKRGKVVAEAAVRVENNAEKFAANAVRKNGTQVEEIRLGGTHTRLVFEKSGAQATN